MAASVEPLIPPEYTRGYSSGNSNSGARV